MKPIHGWLVVLVFFLASCSDTMHEFEVLSSSLEIPSIDTLEGWISQRESQVPGIKPGVAAGIIWADPARQQRTEFAVVYLHGYTATRGEIAPVPDKIAMALGANLYYPRLTGHGVGPEGHRSVTRQDWQRDALEALAIGKTLGKRVIVVATSTGATLASWLVLGPAKADVAASILVSPNLTPVNRLTDLLLWPGREFLLQWIKGETIVNSSNGPLNDQYWDLTHNSHSLIPMMELVDLVRNEDFSLWSSPVLVVYDPSDTVVDESVTVKLFSRVPGSLAVLSPWSTRAGENSHVLAGDILSPGGTRPLVDLSLGFLERSLRR